MAAIWSRDRGIKKSGAAMASDFFNTDGGLLCCGSFCLCLFGGILCLESSLGGSLFCCELLGFLLSHSLALYTVLLNLGLETSLCILSCLGIEFCFCCLFAFVVSLFPGVETTFCLCLVESTFLNTSVEVLHQHNALFRENAANCVGRYCSYLYPIQSTVEV